MITTLWGLKFWLVKQSSNLKSSPSAGDLHQGLQLIECGFTSSGFCPGCLSRLRPVKMMYSTAAISQHIHIQIFFSYFDCRLVAQIGIWINSVTFTSERRARSDTSAAYPSNSSERFNTLRAPYVIGVRTDVHGKAEDSVAELARRVEDIYEV